MVVTRDSSEHGLGELLPGASVPETLDVEDQVHPQDGEQEPTASGEQRGHVIIVSQALWSVRGFVRAQDLPSVSLGGRENEWMRR